MFGPISSYWFSLSSYSSFLSPLIFMSVGCFLKFGSFCLSICSLFYSLGGVRCNCLPTGLKAFFCCFNTISGAKVSFFGPEGSLFSRWDRPEWAFTPFSGPLSLVGLYLLFCSLFCWPGKFNFFYGIYPWLSVGMKVVCTYAFFWMLLGWLIISIIWSMSTSCAICTSS